MDENLQEEVVAYERQLALEMVARNGLALQQVGSLQADREVVLASLAADPKAFKFAHESVRNDYSVASVAIALCPWNIIHLRDEFKNDTRIGMLAVGGDSKCIGQLSPRLQADDAIQQVARMTMLMRQGDAVRPVRPRLDFHITERTGIINYLHRQAEAMEGTALRELLEEIMGKQLVGKRRKRMRDYEDLASSWRRLVGSLPSRHALHQCYVRPGVRSDVLVGIEIFETQGYVPTGSAAVRRLLGLRQGDGVADVGANVGFYAVFANEAMDGVGFVDCWEPSVFTGALLKLNVRSLQSDTMRVNVHQKLVTASGRAEWFDDLTFTNKGAVRSGTTKKCPYDFQVKGKRTYMVDAVRLPHLLTESHTVLKLDIERSELAVLEDERIVGTLQKVRLLFVEISRRWLVKKNPTGSGWKKLERIFQVFERCGITHVQMPAGAFTAKYWKVREDDFLLIAYRSCADPQAEALLQGLTPKEVKKLTRWRSFGAELGADWQVLKAQQNQERHGRNPGSSKDGVSGS